MNAEKEVYLSTDPQGDTPERKAAFVVFHEYIKEVDMTPEQGAAVLHFAWYFAGHLRRYREVVEAINAGTFREELREE